MEKITADKIQSFKRQNRKIAMLTAYDYPFAKILDEAGIDIVLVGDSLGNVALGYQNTLPVTMEEMEVHTRAVARGVKRAMVVADLPFGSYQINENEAVKNAIRLVKAGAEAVKLEGAGYLGAIKKIIKAGIPVMGHLGFTPQSVNLKGPRVKGQGSRGTKQLMNEAKMLEKTGCFAVVLELVEAKAAGKITKSLNIPTIGIGSGKHVGGQVLVTNDLLGLYENPPNFVKKYAELAKISRRAINKFLFDSESKVRI